MPGRSQGDITGIGRGIRQEIRREEDGAEADIYGRWQQHSTHSHPNIPFCHELAFPSNVEQITK